ncbi:MAG: hypothetical protein IJO08_03040 [Clostridia bacterium]|nr:hypothetical protein [Clostridia bacterium]
MNYLFKLIVEGLINNCKVFENTIANVVLASVALFVAFVPAWDSTHFLYKTGIIRIKDSGSATHWFVRGAVAFLVILLVKIAWTIICFVHNNFLKLSLILAAGIIVYFVVLKCEKTYRNRMKEN